MAHFRNLVFMLAAPIWLAGIPSLWAQSPTFTQYVVPGLTNFAIGITAGPDGALWFTQANGLIGRITTAGVVSEYAASASTSNPAAITAGPDGALWYTENAGSNKIGRITTAGAVTEYSIPTANSNSGAITAGPDYALWFTESAGNKIGRIDPSYGLITEYAVPTPNSAPNGIAAGSDGALWFIESSGNKIGRITTAGVVTEYAIPTLNSNPAAISKGSDGALWFTENSGNKIGQITTAGVVTEYAVPTSNSGPDGIAAGPDGALWFTESNGNKIGRITTGGAIAEYALSTPNRTPSIGITAGPDGALWFTEYGGDQIGRMTTAGVLSGSFALPVYDVAPEGVTAGPDGALWFTELVGNKIGRITTAGVIAEYAVPTLNSYPDSIKAGPDGALWFTELNSNKIGRITTAGVITEYPVNGQPYCLTVGSDQAIWFTELLGNKIGRITTAGVVTEYAIPTSNSIPYGITGGPDGALWFVEFGGNKVARITTGGVITEYLVPTTGGGPVDIAAGPDGALWFTEFGNRIGRITIAGVIAEYSIPASSSILYGITAGPDGALWFADTNRNQIGRITTAGVITEFAAPGTGPLSITTGPDGALWFTDLNDQIGQAVLQAVITSISPTALTAGGSAFTLTVNGQGFAPGAVVQWNGSALSTNSVSSTQLTASVTPDLIASAGSANVTVVNPGGATSVAAPFTILPPPTISGLSPFSATAGGPAFTLTVNGANFLSGSIVQWNGVALPTTVGETQLTASVSMAQIASPGSVNVTVVNPGGGGSAPLQFTILAPTGQTWTLLTTAGQPPARLGAAAVFDPPTKQMIIFGGAGVVVDSGSPDLNDTWSLNATTNQWSQLAPTGTAPHIRVGMSAVYDAANSRMTIFGGGENQSSPCDQDVWVLSNANRVNGTPAWTQLMPNGGSPMARLLHQAVYDPGSNRMIVFGGNNCFNPGSGGVFYNDVWVLTNANGLGGTPEWIQLSPSGTLPSARRDFSAIYDPVSNNMTVFGGVGYGPILSDVWVLSNANGLGGTPAWTQLTPAGGSISARAGHTAVYDGASNRMVVFGGGNDNQVLNDTWTLSNANGLGGTPTWTQLAPLGTIPHARTAHTSVYDPSSNRMIVFSGTPASGTPLNDVWALGGAIAPAPVTVTSVPPGVQLIVDGSAFTAPQTFSWAIGSTHQLVANAPPASNGTRLVFTGWSDGGGQIHNIVVPATGAIYTAAFKTQYLLTTAVSPPGAGTVSVAPGSPSSDGYYDSGTSVQLTAAPAARFLNWSGDLTGSANPQSILLTAARSVTANFGTGTTVTSNPSGLQVIVDGSTVTTPASFVWAAGSAHTIGVSTPQGNGGSRSVFTGWSDGGAQSHTITVPAADTVYTAAFKTQYLLTTAVSPPGAGSVTASPASPDGYYDSGTSVQLTAAPAAQFLNWSGDLSGSTNPQSILLTAARSVTANFGTGITVTTTPSGLQAIVDGSTITTPQNFAWAVGSSHTIGVNSPQGSGGSRSVFTGWSDGGAQSHTITVPATAIAYAASFKTQYLLTTTVAPAGAGTVTASPASTDGYYDSGTSVQAAAAPAAQFLNWNGDLSGSTNPQSVVLSAPRSVTANFSTLPVLIYAIAVSAQPTKITDQPGLTLMLNQPSPVPLDAQFTLSFTPNAANLPASGTYISPAVQFATGGTSTKVTIQSSNTTWPIPAVQIGDVAGTITVTLSNVTVSGTSQVIPLPNPLPTTTITVPALAPIITPGSVRIANVTASGFMIALTAVSTPRDLVGATVTFTAAPGKQLNGTAFTVPLSNNAQDWFQSAAGQSAGGAFNLQIPFPFSGDPSTIGSVSVTLTNSVGVSVAVSGTR